MSSDTFSPLTLLSLAGEPLALVRTGSLPSVLPFDVGACTQRTVASVEEGEAISLRTEKQWRLQAKVCIALDASCSQHWVLVTSESGTRDVCHAVDDVTADGFCQLESALEAALAEAFPGPQTKHDDIRVFLMSEPSANKVSRLVQFPVPGAVADDKEGTAVNERVLLADTVAQLSRLVSCALASFFVEERTAPTAVFWPPQLPFPVNVHPSDDALRVAEHEELLLPRRGLLRREHRVRSWKIAADIPRPSAETTTLRFRTGAAWERHLATNPHEKLENSPTPAVSGASTLLTTGRYDYYHYRVDGFKDDGWGCAYRSLQTILSWFQHEGLMAAPMPSLRDIQQILFDVDPDKAGKRGFVGSSEWIGSFEIMMVLQHFLPGLECTIKRLESAAELDTDPTIQGLLFSHFSHAPACPVMIGGSSYAHTILGVHMNVETTEAQYLILDPHYAAHPTNVKSAIGKGYVGWKEAIKFFEASQWYNVCIPRVDLLDPR